MPANFDDLTAFQSGAINLNYELLQQLLSCSGALYSERYNDVARLWPCNAATHYISIPTILETHSQNRVCITKAANGCRVGRGSYQGLSKCTRDFFLGTSSWVAILGPTPTVEVQVESSAVQAFLAQDCQQLSPCCNYSWRYWLSGAQAIHLLRSEGARSGLCMPSWLYQHNR